MLRRCLILPLILLAACSGATGPKGPAAIDPSVLFVNQSPDVALIIFASDQSGTLTYDTVPVPARSTVCARWTQTFDSLYEKVIDTLPNTSGTWVQITFPWVHFSQYGQDYFQIDTLLDPAIAQGGAIANHFAATEC